MPSSCKPMKALMMLFQCIAVCFSLGIRALWTPPPIATYQFNKILMNCMQDVVIKYTNRSPKYILHFLYNHYISESILG